MIVFLGYRYKKEKQINFFLRGLLPCLSSLINMNYNSQCKLCRISSYQQQRKNACTLYHTINFKLIPVKNIADNRINAIVEHKFVLRMGENIVQC